jgi:hypothetical protein
MFVINPTTGISEMFLVRPTGSIFFHDERCELFEDYLDDGKSILIVTKLMGQTEKRLWTETIICISCQSFRSGFVRIVRMF